jgi:16S rRNA (guanine966-N2)-methyltransferase
MGMFDDEAVDVLDCFAGTGALGLEALSRGAARALFIEQDPQALAALAANIETLGEGDACRVVKADARRPPKASHPSHLVFLDPPYGKDLVPPTLAALAQKGWLADKAVVVAEVGAEEEPVLPDGFIVTDTRTYGAAKFLILTAA